MKKISILCVMLFVFSFGVFGSPLIVNASEGEIEVETNIEEDTIINDNTAAPMSGGGGSGGDDSNDEDWYDISVENGIPQLPHAVDYSTKPGLINYLKPGDLVYEPVGGMGITGHTAMVYDILYSEEYEQYYVVLIEAVSDDVSYGLLTPTRFIEKEGHITRLTNASQAQINNAIAWATTQLGKSYCPVATKSPYSNNSNWYCSELVWASFYWQGIYLDDDDNDPENGSAVWPEEIYNYSYATLIMHYQFDTTYSSVNDYTHTITCNNQTTTESHNYYELNSCYEKCLQCANMKQTSSHDYTYRYSKMNSLNHYSYCECGTYTIEEHNFTETSINRTCNDCGYTEYINHTHTFIYRSCGDGMYHKAICSCGYNQKELCMGLVGFGSETVCVKCNQVISNGAEMNSNPEDEIVPYLKDEDE